jgi:hypothetical protein
MSNAILFLACIGLCISAAMGGFRHPRAAMVRWGSVAAGVLAAVGPNIVGVLS